jgi:hypothetical protein
MTLTKNNRSITLQVEVALLKKRIEELEAVLKEKEILKAEGNSWELIRAKRDYLLRSTDWTMTPGSTLDQAQWAAYRQILRDLPQTYVSTGPKSVVWPTQPTTLGPNANIE